MEVRICDLMPNIEDTIAFIKKAHDGAEYLPGMPYYRHPEIAMGLLPPACDLEVQLAVLLHDVLEDTDYTAENLLDLSYSPRVIRAVEVVTRHKKIPGRTDVQVYPGGVYEDGMNYLDWVKAILDTDETDAILVKFADMKMNSDPQMLATLSHDKRERFETKYRIPFALICEKLKAMGRLG